MSDQSDSNDFTINTVAMVGGLRSMLIEKWGNDRFMLRLALMAAKTFGVTLSPLLESIHASREGNLLTEMFNHPSANNDLEQVIKIINIHPNEGGQDFLKVDTHTDLVVFCNIPYRIQKLGLGVSFEDAVKINHPFAFDMAASLRVSEYNDDIARWQQKLHQSGAKMAFISGEDDVPAEQLKGDHFAVVRGKKFPHGILIRKDFAIASINRFEQGHPMRDLGIVLRDTIGVDRFIYDRTDAPGAQPVLTPILP